MKKLKYLSILLIASLLFFSCQSTKKAESVAPVSYPELNGEVSSISKYGNIYASISASDAMNSGYEPGDIAIVAIGDSVMDMPVGTSYSDVDNGNYVMRLYITDTDDVIELAINHGNLAGETGATEGTPVTVSMKDKGGYKDEYMIRHLVKSENREDYSSDEVFANFRSVSQGNIPEGIIFRGCNPVYGDSRAPYADELIKSANIVSVINLADSEESALSHMDEAPNYKKIYESGNMVFLNLGIDFFAPEFTEGLKNGLAFLANAETPVYIHCNEGKDRAGMVVALLEALTGSTVDEIVEDYMTSYMNYNGVEKDTEQYNAIGKIIVQFLANLNGGKTPTDSELVNVANNYLVNSVGLTQAQVENIVKNITSK